MEALAQYMALDGKEVTKRELERIRNRFVTGSPETRKERQWVLNDIDRHLDRPGRLGAIAIGKRVQQLGATLFDQGVMQDTLFAEQAPKPIETQINKYPFSEGELVYLQNRLNDYRSPINVYDELLMRNEDIKNFVEFGKTKSQGYINAYVLTANALRLYRLQNNLGDDMTLKKLVELLSEILFKLQRTNKPNFDFAKLTKKQKDEFLALTQTVDASIRNYLSKEKPKPEPAKPAPPKVRTRKGKSTDTPRKRGKQQTTPDIPTPQNAEQETFAMWMALDHINVDPKRFQNRQNAFSEASANAIAENLNWNIFDPIVVWLDPKDGRTYVLSGHSRYEGLKRRGEKKAPVRYYSGTEAEAIQFSKVEANRSATAESLIEDIKAYRLGRDGDPERGIKPMKVGDLKQAFKGKWQKLDDLTYLNEVGAFIKALSTESVSEFPYLERFARWTGQMRKELPQLNDDHEFNIFVWLYDSTAQGYKFDEPTFKDLIRERASAGKEILFDCNPSTGCDKETKELNQFLKTSEERLLQKRVEKINAQLKRISERLKMRQTPDAIWTPVEREFFINWAKELEDERQRIIKETGQALKDQSSLFGVRRKKKAR